MKELFIIGIMVATLFGCSNNDDKKTSEVNLRISNVSEFNFQNVVVNPSGGNVNFGNIESGQISDYKTFGKAYRYGFIELEIDGEIYTYQPIDYTGETPLENGDYTYQINADDSQDQYGRLTLTLIKE